MSRASATASVYSVISDPTRRAILSALAKGQKNPSELCSLTGASPSSASQHLAVLLSVGLVSRTRHGREQHYRIEAGPLREVRDWVRHFDRFWDDKLAALGEYLEKKQ